MPQTSDKTIDAQIRQRIRRARVEASITQHELGEMLGRSSQQIHKYESGSNRVSAGTLFAISQALGHSMEWFFLDIRYQTGGAQPPTLN